MPMAVSSSVIVEVVQTAPPAMSTIGVPDTVALRPMSVGDGARMMDTRPPTLRMPKVVRSR